MALMLCPDCRREMSDSAPACPYCGRPNVAAMDMRKASAHADGQRLVRVSTWLMVLGLSMWAGSCYTGMTSRTLDAAAMFGILGLVVLIVAAVVGQVGRAKQGRIV